MSIWPISTWTGRDRHDGTTERAAEPTTKNVPASLSGPRRDNMVLTVLDERDGLFMLGK